MKRFFFAIASVVAVAAIADSALAQRQDRDRRPDGIADRGNWQELGCVEVRRRAEREVITVGRREGRFVALRLRAERNDVRIQDVTVVYGNGAPDQLRVRSVLQEGEATRPMDLEGRARVIDRVELTLQKDFEGRRRGPARVCVAGLEATPERRPPPLPVANWQELGCVEVRSRAEREVITVGRREGRFVALRLRAERNDVRIQDVTVVYGNGAPDQLRVRSVLREGEATRPMDLEGRARVIDRVELTLQRDFEGRRRGPARVCVAGLEATPERRPPPLPRASWVELGCVGVGLRKDYDVIEVGRREGRFGAVRLRSSGGKVEIHELRVIYGNRTSDSLVVNADLRKNTETGPIELRGPRDRVIARIELVSKRESRDAIRSTLKNVLRGDGGGLGQAEVCVDGLDTRQMGGFRR